MCNPKKIVVIAGAGPAGLTAAYELLKQNDYIVIIFEKTMLIGGISQTYNYNGNRIDIGGHRFFSKSTRVMNWWENILPIQGMEYPDIILNYQNKTHQINTNPKGPDPEIEEKVMLVRNRISRIFHRKKFFDYPVKLNLRTIQNLGFRRILVSSTSYLYSRISKIKPELTLEDFFINRFGKALYKTFFRDYTEKVWGVKCAKISAEWGAQRVKGLSAGKTVVYALQKLLFPKTKNKNNLETSLIDSFLYPKYGPGQLWEEVAAQIIEKGGKIHLGREVSEIILKNNKIKSIQILNHSNRSVETLDVDYFFSTMPVKQLIRSINPLPPENVLNVASNLVYRDFMTVGLLLDKILLKGNNHNNEKTTICDNWIYIQENDVKLARVQIYNNWSPYMLKDSTKIWLGLEYFCNKNDELWALPDKDIIRLAIDELIKIGFINSDDVIDHTLLRMEKTYPAYFGSYPQFGEIRAYTDQIKNLFLIGRNGMHRYNNMDHSMLTAMVAVENIIAGISEKNNIWQVNTEKQHHEEQKKQSYNSGQ